MTGCASWRQPNAAENEPPPLAIPSLLRDAYRRKGSPGQSGGGAVNDTVITDSVKQFKWVGTRPIRPDGVPKVTGRAMYGGDYKLPGMLYGKILRSPHAHARIRSIDTSAAQKLPGVKAIVTSKDIPDQR